MSSKKQLLGENTVRRFMKLAELAPLTENFLEDVNENEEEITEGEDEEITEGEEEPVEEGKAGDMGRKDVANVVPDGGQLKEEDDLEEPGMEPEMEPGLEPEMEPEAAPLDAAGTIDVAEFMQAFQQALEQVTGQDVEVETGEEAPMEEPPADLDMAPEEEAPARNMYENLLEDAGIDIIDEDAIVSEVVRRVATRLVKSKLSK